MHILMSFLVSRQYRWYVCLWTRLITTKGKLTFLVVSWQLLLPSCTPLSCRCSWHPAEEEPPWNVPQKDRNRTELCPATSQRAADPWTKCAMIPLGPLWGHRTSPRRCHQRGWMWDLHNNSFRLECHKDSYFFLCQSWLFGIMAIIARRLTLSLIWNHPPLQYKSIRLVCTTGKTEKHNKGPEHTKMGAIHKKCAGWQRKVCVHFVSF